MTRQVRLNSTSDVVLWILSHLSNRLFDGTTSKKIFIMLHGPTMFAVRAKIYGVLYNQASSIAFDETTSYWSPRGNLVSIGQHFVITRVVHLPKRTETT